jgi:hypothetical protein
MVWGMSSRLTHVTVVPTGTFKGVGENLKLSIVTCASAAAAKWLPTVVTATMTAEPMTRHSKRRPGINISFMIVPCEVRQSYPTLLRIFPSHSHGSRVGSTMAHPMTAKHIAHTATRAVIGSFLGWP